MNPLVFDFHEGRAEDRRLLGGKGAYLAEMTRLGLPVPPGFTITTEACRAYLGSGMMPEGLEGEIRAAMARLEERAGKRFGDPALPLLVSVRSGAPVSMPGMMDTILNLGLNDATVEGLAAVTGDPRFAYDCHRRFIQMFGDVVLKVPMAVFEGLLEQARRRAGVSHDHQLDAQVLKGLAQEFRQAVLRAAGRPFPDDPWQQLMMAVRAVFESWRNQRAVVYRRIHGISEEMGTAVNVQAMVFGNMGGDSGTGVLFTRDPATGERTLYGEYLPNAQGEDVVAGVRTPMALAHLADSHPALHAELERVARTLEARFRDAQDIEFTVERGRLFILQTRAAKRTARAAVRVARDMVAEGLLSPEGALLRIDPLALDQLLHPAVDPAARVSPLATGLPASPGAVTGEAVFDADAAERLARAGHRVILVRPETSPDDIHGMAAAEGVLTTRGGMTSHAAIVARGMGKPCVVGCEAIAVEPDAGRMSVDGRVIQAGEVISIDGSTGHVYAGPVPLVPPSLPPELAEVLSWADRHRRLGVKANADTPEDARRARELGAEGIGLCRTEHMFLGRDRLPAVQEVILAATEEERTAALERILPMQERDFEGILRAMEGLPVTIRLLDPPLHEFLPDVGELEDEVRELEARAAAGDGEARAALPRRREILCRARELREANPMLGHRGCRLGISYPEIYAMQARAIFRAAARLAREGLRVFPQVMIPLVADRRELELLRRVVEEAAREETAAAGVAVECKVGTMIEVPRAALTAGAIASHADFFSFGTNDLTQMTFGLSRDDAEARFLGRYMDAGILPANPFQTLDREGVGRLMEMAVREGRAARPGLEVGICGEHGGDPASIAFCHSLGLDYVSCSPFRVPAARLAAAQAALGAARG